MKRIYTLFLITACLSCSNEYKNAGELLNYPSYSSIKKALKEPNHVYELNLKDTADSVDINDIAKLNTIQRLKLHSKCNIDTFPSELINLKNLDWVFVKNSRIVSIDHQVQHFPHLRILEITESKIREFPVWLCTDWVKIETLSLRGNYISILPRDIGKMSQLRSLNLSNNSIESIPFEIGELKNLEHLNLSNNKITKIPKTVASLYKNLKSINLIGNDIDSTDIDFLKENLPYTNIKTQFSK